MNNVKESMSSFYGEQKERILSPIELSNITHYFETKNKQFNILKPFIMGKKPLKNKINEFT